MAHYLDPKPVVYNTVTILTDGTESTVLCKRRYNYMAIILPADWVTGTITFKGCNTPTGTFLSVVKGSDVAAVTIPSVAASKYIVLDGTILEALRSVPYIMLVAGAAQTTNDKTITVVLSR